MRRIILVVALVALLVVAAVVPAVADPSPTGLGSIVPTLAKAALPDDVLPASWVSSDEDISAENEEAAENSNAILSSFSSYHEISNSNR